MKKCKHEYRMSPNTVGTHCIRVEEEEDTYFFNHFYCVHCLKSIFNKTAKWDFKKKELIEYGRRK